MYSIYGLTIASDRPLVGVSEANAVAGAPDLRIHFGSSPAWSEQPTDPARVLRREPADAALPARHDVAWVRSGEGIRFVHDDGSRFFLDRSARELWATWPATLTFDDVLGYLLGNILGFVLRQQGVLAFHASGVVVDGRAWAFAGVSGDGKSSLAAALNEAGFPMLTDDVFAVRDIDGVLTAFPGHDHFRMTAVSVERFATAQAPTTPLVAPTWDKYRVRTEQLGHPRATTPAPLGGIFGIGDRQRGDEFPRVRRLDPRQAFLTLLPYTTASSLMETASQAQAMPELVGVIAQVPVFLIESHTEFVRLPLLVERVLRAIRG